MRSFHLLLVTVTAKVFILGPPGLKAEMQSRNPGLGEVKASLGNFGNPPYGTSIVGRAFYDKHNPYVCDPVTLNFADEPDTVSVPILMSKRGGCTFAQKARWAENAGAKALLVVDNVDELVEFVVMTDSGYGGNIQIPSFLVGKRDGEEVLRYVEQLREEVVVKLQFEVRKNERVRMELWFSPNEQRANSFLSDFSPYGREFPLSHLNFTPHYALWNCRECLDSKFTLDHPDCISGGRYCAPDPDGTGPAKGRDVILEDIREICVFEQSLRKETYLLWMDYMREFNATCVGNADFSEKCSNLAMKSAKINIKDVNTCFNRSFTGQSISKDDNSLMKREKDSWNDQSTGLYPSILLNSVMYRGDWEGLHVAKTICASFFSAPSICEKLDTLSGRENQAEAEGRVSTSLAVVIVAIVLLVIVCVLVGYRMYLGRELKETMNQQVSLAVSQYRALGGEAELEARNR